MIVILWAIIAIISNSWLTTEDALLPNYFNASPSHHYHSIFKVWTNNINYLLNNEKIDNCCLHPSLQCNKVTAEPILPKSTWWPLILAYFIIIFPIDLTIISFIAITRPELFKSFSGMELLIKTMLTIIHYQPHKKLSDNHSIKNIRTGKMGLWLPWTVTKSPSS